MKKNNHKFKKTYLIFFIGTFILGNILPGINSTIVANTNGLIEASNENDNEIKSQTDSGSNEEIDLDIDKQAQQNEILPEKSTSTKDSGDIATGTKGTSKWRIDSEGTLHIGEGRWNTTLNSEEVWRSHASEIQKIVFEGKVEAINGIKTMFKGLTEVKTIENISYLDVSQVYAFDSAFEDMKSLKSLDLSSWDTSYKSSYGSVFSSMFSGMSSLTYLNVSTWDVSQVGIMTMMFAGTNSLESLDISRWNTDSLFNTANMFLNSGLKSLDLSNWNMSKVSNMNQMFANSNIESLNLSGWDNSAAYYRDGVFSNIPIKQLVLGPKIILYPEMNLPDVLVNESYTGKWINVGIGTIESPKGTNIWSSTELLTRYNGAKDADTYIWERNLQLDVNTKMSNILLGTDISDINPDEFIDSVKLGSKYLSKNEYIVKMTSNPKTTQVGSSKTKLEVIPIVDESKALEVEATANIVWGSTLVAKDSILNGTDVSVSLLHKNGKPYLKANEGEGFSSRDTLSTRPMYRFYRDSEENFLFEAHYWSIGNSHSEVEERWNRLFSEKVLEYGDVVIADIRKDNNAFSWNGNNTFISKNNMLVRDTIGYDYAYYELTPSGYRLLRLNQLVVNNNQKVKLNASKEEMNKNISNYISLPEQIENPNDFRMEFESVDTASSGNKKSTINVYETLESGGEFKTTYEVAYTVYPEITESYYDVDGKQIEQSQTTEFEYGKEFAPSPEKYIENNGVLYIYKGWVDALPGTGAIIPQEGIPAPTLVEKNYYYIYEKADKFITVTLPTEVVFGTFDSNNKISSKKYEIKNNSDELPIEVSLEQFDKVTSDIKLLSSNTPDPTQEEASAKLNLYVDNKSVISGLTEDTPTQSITKIDTNTSRAISLEGTYFGNMSDKNILDYKMHLKFKAARDNKN
ncbi:BspA family leucine-rich repeat surface protein [Lactococcus garvieae]|uniref:BspA family leucine-rich repeat surface protein n=1 Tax=Lactococcus garvieae TaxID=1363 RepID=UPI002549C57C|nr:BspA family leucine-rich repeat surface protein [Lactococcus garvieae]